MRVYIKLPQQSRDLLLQLRLVKSSGRAHGQQRLQGLVTSTVKQITCSIQPNLLRSSIPDQLKQALTGLYSVLSERLTGDLVNTISNSRIML